jgi:hypothetical protein
MVSGWKLGGSHNHICQQKLSTFVSRNSQRKHRSEVGTGVANREVIR